MERTHDEKIYERRVRSMKDGIHGRCVAQGWNCTRQKKKQTNADRIRSMSDEELAEFLVTVETYGYYDQSVSGTLEMFE